MAELHELEDVVDAAKAGRGGLVVISGEPGIGKSRLVREFFTRHPEVFLVTAAAHLGSGQSFAVWIDLLQTLTRRGIYLDGESSVLEDLLAGAANHAGSEPVSTDQLGDIANVLIELLNQAPGHALVVIEDMQAMDRESLRLLRQISFTLANEPITIVATRRTDLSGWSPTELPIQSIRIDLRGLSVSDVCEAISDYYKSSSLEQVADFVAMVHRATRGNPSAVSGIVDASEGTLPNQSALLDRLLATADHNAQSGNAEAAYSLYSRAADLAEQVGEPRALARAAIGFAFPPDWRTGNPDALALIKRASLTLGISGIAGVREKIVVDSLRAMLEMRIPQRAADGQQWAWVTRPAVAQPIADHALERARTEGDEFAVLVALIAWRWTHRGPGFLTQRTEVSTEAKNLAVSGDHPDLLIEAAVRSTVDALERGDRHAAHEAITIADWIADQTQDPRIQWRSAVLRAAFPGLDGDWEQFAACRADAIAFGIRANHPGTYALDAALQAQYLIHTVDFSGWEYDKPEYVQIAALHPLSSSTWAFGLAHLGLRDQAARWVRSTLAILDEESSLVASLALLGLTAVRLRDVVLARRMIRLLRPWSGRVALDADATVIVGPVDLVLARLLHMVGDHHRARALARTGQGLQNRMTGAESNLDRFLSLPASDVGKPDLTQREVAVLRGLGAGLTNQEIAAQLSFSLATVRRDTISLYRKLQVRGRAGAVQKASELGLLDMDGDPGSIPP